MIHYLIGDATQPNQPGTSIICHICNDKGKWGAGFVLAISKRWEQPERMYRQIKNYILGKVQYVDVLNDDVKDRYIYIANMIAQHNTGPDKDGNPPIRYDALRTCLNDVNSAAMLLEATVHMPRIGCGLAGGDWSVVEKIIQETLTVDVYVYDLPTKN
jgi:O-acetyl-ADP-ribose deacetylase (regulator of RNase III)